jgi:hypothetical protein
LALLPVAGAVSITTAASPAAAGVAGLAAEPLVASTPVAGGGSGDGGPAAASFIGGAGQVALAPDGSLVFADPVSNSVRSIGLDGTLRRIAGDGVSYLDGGFSGDGGPAISAQLSHPEGVQVSSEGVVYIADTGNRRIRRIGTDGVISTVAGTGGEAPQATTSAATGADTVPHRLRLAADGSLYFTEWGTGGADVRKLTSQGELVLVAGQTGAATSATWHFDGVPATAATLHQPLDVLAGPAGAVYVLDSARVLEVSASDATIRSVAGVGSPTFTGGNAGDGGPATEAWIDNAQALEFGEGGTILISGDDRIRRVTVGGTVEFDRSTDSAPASMVRDGSDLLFSATGVITRVTQEGVSSRVAGAPGTTPIGEGLPALEAHLGQISAIAPAPSGGTYLADSVTRRVWLMNGETGVLTIVAGSSAGATSFTGERGAATDAALPAVTALTQSAGSLYLAFSDSTVRRIQDGVITTVAGTGAPGSGGDEAAPGTSVALGTIAGLAPDGSGGLLVLDSSNGRIRAWQQDGTIHTVAGGGAASGRPAEGQAPSALHLLAPTALTAGPGGTLYVSAYAADSRPWLYALDGQTVRTAVPLNWPARLISAGADQQATIADGYSISRYYSDGASEIVSRYHPRAAGYPISAHGVLGDGRLAFAAGINNTHQVWAVPGRAPAMRPAAVTGVTLGSDKYSPTVSWVKPTDTNIGVTVVLRKGSSAAARWIGDGGGGGAAGDGTPLWTLFNDENGTPLAWGSPYTVSVFSYDKTTGTTSAPAVQTFIARKPLRCTITPSTTTVTYGTKLTVTGTFVVGNDQRAAGVPATITAAPAGKATTTVASTPATPVTGTLAYGTVPDRRTTYTATHAADTNAPCSASTTVQVAPSVQAGLTAARVRARATTTLSAAVLPAVPGQQVSFQVRSGTTWKHLGWKTLDKNSRVAFPASSTTRGTFAYRIVRSADTTHVQGISRTVTLTVF